MMTDTSSSLLLMRDAVVYAPEPVGIADVLCAGDQIIGVAKHLDAPSGIPCRTIDAVGRTLVPGLIDSHVHLLGGGGEAGPASRVPEIQLSQLARAGVTTAVGVLGTDSLTRTPEALLAKARGFKQDGITAFIWTGAYRIPSPTITGNVIKDIALIEDVIGVKTAISDHRSAQPTTDELARLASEARIGGMLAGIPGLVHVHVGDGSQGLEPLLTVVAESDIPIGQFLPTHINRSADLLLEGIEFVQRGGTIDLTVPSDIARGSQAFSASIRTLRNGKTDLSSVTFSTDGNGSMPRFDEKGRVIGMGVGRIANLWTTVKALVQEESLTLEEALAPVTVNPATRLGLVGKGRIRPGCDADFLLLDESLTIDTVVARGRILVANGKPLVAGAFE